MSAPLRCAKCGLRRKECGRRNVGVTMTADQLRRDAHDFQPTAQSTKVCGACKVMPRQDCPFCGPNAPQPIKAEGGKA